MAHVERGADGEGRLLEGREAVIGRPFEPRGEGDRRWGQRPATHCDPEGLRFPLPMLKHTGDA